MSITQNDLEKALHLPDFDPIPVRLPMVPADRALAPPPPNHKLGAVLALFYPEADDLKVILVRRPSNMRNRPGQIAFPGGRQDEGETFEQTAIRETWEEIGVASDKFTVLGEIDPLYIPPSRFYVYCFAAWANERPTYIRSEAEVAEILEISYSHFVGDKNRGREPIDVGLPQGPIDVPFFSYKDYKIWGATSTMLAELAHRIELVRSG